MRRLLWVFTLCLFCTSSFPQGEKKVKESISYRHYGFRDGLVQLQVFRVFQDSRNYMWFSTFGGVSRFDGKEFKNYTGEKSLSDGRLAYVVGEYDDFLYFVSGNGCIKLLYSDDRIEEYRLPDNHIALNVNQNSVYHQHKIYIFGCITRDQGQSSQRTFPFYVFDLRTKQFHRGAYLMPSLHTLLTDGQTLVGIEAVEEEMNSLRFYRIEEENSTLFNEVNLLSVSPYIKKLNANKCFTPSLNDPTTATVWTYANGELSSQPLPYVNGEKYSSGVELAPDTYLMFYPENKRPVRIKDGKVEVLPMDLPIVNQVYTDNIGNIWMATENGVFNFHQGVFRTYEVGLTLNDYIWDFKKDMYGHLWFNTYGLGLWRSDPDGRLQKAQGFFSMYGYMHGTEDVLGRIFFTHADGLSVFDPRKGNHARVDTLKIGCSLFCYYDSLTQNVYAGSIDHPMQLMNVFDKDLNKTVYSIAMGNIISICRDGNQRLRFGTFNGEGYLDEAAGQLVKDTTQRSYRSLIAMETDRQGNLWKGTEEGLIVESKDGVDSLVVPGSFWFVGNYREKYIITGGDDGELYLLDLPAYQKDKTIHLRQFGYNQGVDALGFGQNGYSVDREGYVWIIVSDKMLGFYPDEVMHTPEYRVKTPQIAGIYYGNNQQQWWLWSSEENEKVENRNNNLRYEVLSAFPAAPERLRLRYRLLPFQPQWQESSVNSFSFQSLPFGYYRFEVEASLDGINWSPTLSAPSVTIMPPFLFSFWGVFLQVFIGICLLALLAALVRRQTIRQQQRAREVERLRFRAVRSKYIPHFTGNVLNSINYLMRKDNDSAQKYLNEFSRFYGQTLLSSDALYRTLEEELEYARLYLNLEKLRFEEKLDFSFSIAPEVNLLLPIPSMVLQTFCENALKHGLRHKEGGGNVRIEAEVKGLYHRIVVEDNGIGRQAARVMHTEGSGEGLAIVQQQLELYSRHKSRTPASLQIVDLNDAQGQPTGTRMELYIPSDIIYRIKKESYV